MGTLSGVVTLLLLPPISLGVNSYIKQFASFKSRPFFEKTALIRKANRKSQKSFPFAKMTEKDGGIFIHLKTLYSSGHMFTQTG